MPDAVLKPGVTAVVCCHNSAEVIGPTIRGLAAQDVPDGTGYEVILVDNNCTDGTAERASAAWGSVRFPLRVLQEPRPGLVHARRKGALAAVYDTVLFADDDNVLERDWVSRIPQIFRKMPNVGIIGGNNIADVQGERPVWFDRFQAMYACGPRAETAALNPKKDFGAGLAFRAALVQSVLSSPLPMFLTGRIGSRPALGEDSELVLRCQLSGRDYYYEPALRLRHRILAGRLSWDYLLSLARESGKAWIILQIYQRLREEKNPPTYGGLLFDVGRRWVRYLKKHRGLGGRAGAEGEWRSIGRARLEGMSRGLMGYGNAYSRIRRRIMRHSWRLAP